MGWTKQRGGEPTARISRAGRATAALFGLNTALLFFPPIPPYVKGSIWSYGLKTLVVILAMVETYRQAERATRWWVDLSGSARWALGVGLAGAAWTVGLAMRALGPGLFERFSAEVGPWETISTASYACGMVLLWRVSGSVGGDPRGHLRLVAGGFLVLLLEETDYAGIFGGLVGRVDGIYVGSLHDFINLAAHGLLPPGLMWGSALVAVALGLGLWRGNYVQPHLIGRTLWSQAGAWLALGLLAQLVAAAGEAGMLGALFAWPSAEELIEMTGSLCLAGFALQVAAGARDGHAHHEPDDRERRNGRHKNLSSR